MVLIVAVASLVLVRGVIRALTAIAERRYPAPGKRVDVGGRQLDYYCLGEGGPTIVLESGLGGTWAEWALVQPQVAKFARVCSYDRAGYGWSDPGPEPRTAEAIAGDLHRFLVNSRLPGPYILVGHSLGAFTSCLYCVRHPGEAAGLVLVDPVREDKVPPARRLAGFPGTGVQRLLRLWKGEQELPGWLKNSPPAFGQRYIMWSPPRQLEAEQSELRHAVETQQSVRAAPGFGDLPVVVVTAAAPAAGSAAEIRAYQIESEAALAHRSSRGKQVLADHSHHFIHMEQPELIVEAIREVVDASRHPQTASSASPRVPPAPLSKPVRHPHRRAPRMHRHSG